MADQELERTDAAVESGAAEAAAGSTGSEQATRQPEPPKVNLDDFEDFRKYKSSTQQRLSATERRAQEAEQRARSLEQQWHQQQMASMDELQRTQYEKDLLARQLQQEREERQRDFYAWQREQDIQSVVRKLGVNRDELLEALPAGADSFVMWDVATDLAAKRSTEAKRNDPVRQQANQVDLGGGKPADTANEYQRMYERAKTENDVSAMLDAWAAADRAGVAIKG